MAFAFTNQINVSALYCLKREPARSLNPERCILKKTIVILHIYLFLLTGAATTLFADHYIGLGFSGVTLGRSIPALHVALISDSLRFSFISTGVKTSVYYHNAYQVSAYSTWKPGELLWGKLEAGFGGGLLYAIRGYRENPDEDYEKEGNAVWGPTIYLSWEVLPSVLITLEAIYGLHGSDPLQLVFQENCAGSIGVRF